MGRDFPVFLHPQTGEEYALARTERKTGPGYRGFVVAADPGVTLEEDLRRRDLTINAMAEDADGNLIDPFGGANDLRDKLLRHVSPAFVEDPELRVLPSRPTQQRRQFRIADETRALMRQMVQSGEVDHLVAERVWTETHKALAEPRQLEPLRTLRDCGALRVLFPEIDALYGVPQRAEYHPEIDTGVHTEMVLDMAARLAPGDALIGWCALVHDLGKALTPKDQLPRHHAHEHTGIAPIAALSTRLRIPSEYAALAQLVCRLHLLAHSAFELKPATVLDVFERLDAWRRPERMRQFLLICEADKRGRLGLEDQPYPQAAYLAELFRRAREPAAQALLERGLQGGH